VFPPVFPQAEKNPGLLRFHDLKGDDHLLLDDLLGPQIEFSMENIEKPYEKALV